MNLLFVISVAFLAVGFLYVAGANYDFQTGAFKTEPSTAVKPPYYFQENDVKSEFNGFFFVFLFSLLFFGLSAPIALAVEGAKYGTLISTQGVRAFDFAFAIPEVLAAYSAVLLGQAVMNDLGSEKNVFDAWSAALKFFAAGLALTALLVAARTFLSL